MPSFDPDSTRLITPQLFSVLTVKNMQKMDRIVQQIEHFGPQMDSFLYAGPAMAVGCVIKKGVEGKLLGDGWGGI
jgi:hypothetical protein